MLIRDILGTKSPDIHAIYPDEPISVAIDKMVKLDIGSLIVMQGGRMAGLVTLREILRGINRYGREITDMHISEIMCTNPVIGAPDSTVEYVRAVMTDNHVSHLPVLEGDKLVGVISLHDVARACLNEAEYENTMLKRYIAM
ncbi:MAG: CBS domain-containing protein [Proteobacteria bacterium]|nr:CBS domain-containing protein [Pseudomonadota bacterium]MDE3207782.1 CBS domain-containing protein [Pseudomonadota bacterium]